MFPFDFESVIFGMVLLALVLGITWFSTFGLPEMLIKRRTRKKEERLLEIQEAIRREREEEADP